ncbi:hypothetical protein [Agromyces sp. SYSU T0242]|uniref:hypothetical protein n=1 Tax=Agromyces litoreus TaxID=3158561 RepID=UPI0033956252
MSGGRRVEGAQLSALRHAATITAMAVIAIAVSVAATAVLVRPPTPGPVDGAGALVDLVSVSVAVVAALLSLAALTMASVAGVRPSGARCRVPWASPRLGALANASVWSVIAALAVASAADAFGALPGGDLGAGVVTAGVMGLTTGSVHLRAHRQRVYRSFNLVAMVLAAGRSRA